ncbi:unnamed protein product [Camellia sinensis]
MEWSWSLLPYSIIISSTTFLLLLLHFLRRQKPISGRLPPPGPPGWPVFGNMFDFGTTPHRTVAELKKKYGPVVWIRLGSVNTMVILTANAATELFKNHDQSFADRHPPTVLGSHNFIQGSFAFAPYSAYWRLMKRLINMEIKVANKMNETAPTRRKSVDDMLSWIDKEAGKLRGKRAIMVADFVFHASANMVGNLMVSRDVAGPESEMGLEFLSAMMEILKLIHEPNMADLFPWFRWLDPQGLRRKMDHELGKILAIISGFVKERTKERREGGERRKDLLEVLLDSEGTGGKDEPDKLTEHQISGVTVEMFIAGTETTSSTIECAMAELLRNPEIMIKAKVELNNVVGQNKKMEESDTDHLQYLQSVVKETLRLHPPAPSLIPRKAIHDTNFMGYHIPKNTQVVINAWAIGRDPNYWDEPMSFKPERFIGSKIDYKGQHYEFLPFGAGRRMCIGVPLGHRMLHLLLGSLLHEFDWELECRVNGETMDMRDRIEPVLAKLQSLEVVPKRCRKID